MQYIRGPYFAYQSSWLKSYGYGMDTDKSRGIKSYMGQHDKGLVITFKDNVRCFYPGTSEAQFRALHAAKSKGKWVHRNVFINSYRVV